eukprot:scaffold7431_cov267-Pinguiococcus_pyrenoidosus.AAC.2
MLVAKGTTQGHALHVQRCFAVLVRLGSVRVIGFFQLLLLQILLLAQLLRPQLLVVLVVLGRRKGAPAESDGNLRSVDDLDAVSRAQADVRRLQRDGFRAQVHVYILAQAKQRHGGLLARGVVDHKLALVFVGPLRREANFYHRRLSNLQPAVSGGNAENWGAGLQFEFGRCVSNVANDEALCRALLDRRGLEQDVVGKGQDRPMPVRYHGHHEALSFSAADEVNPILPNLLGLERHQEADLHACRHLALFQRLPYLDASRRIVDVAEEELRFVLSERLVLLKADHRRCRLEQGLRDIHGGRRCGGVIAHVRKVENLRHAGVTHGRLPPKRQLGEHLGRLLLPTIAASFPTSRPVIPRSFKGLEEEVQHRAKDQERRVVGS